MKQVLEIFSFVVIWIPSVAYGQIIIKTDTVTVPANTRCQLYTNAWNYANAVTGSLVMTWDTTKLEWMYIDYTHSALYSHSMTADTSQTHNGKIAVFWIDTTGNPVTLPDSSLLLTQEFFAREDALLHIQSAIVSNSQKDSLATQVTNGQVRIPHILVSLDWITFKALCDKQYIHLQWSIANQQDSIVCFVEESRDGISWKTRTKTQPKMQSFQGITSYEVTLLAPQARCYYRIRAQELDGSICFSQIVTQQCNQIEPAFPYSFPNPATTMLMVALPESDNTSLEMLNQLGQSVYKTQWSGTRAGDVYPLHLPGGVLPGVYRVVISCDGVVTTHNITIVTNQ